jgi:phosphoglycolate phosphatase
VYVGDNLVKDMVVAQDCGVLGVWAEYGTYVSNEYRERLQVISAQSVTRRHVSDDVAEGRPQVARWPLAISSFSQVLDIVDGARWSLPQAARKRPSRRRAR